MNNNYIKDIQKPYGTIYECVVVDNTTFWKTGKIKIRICRDSNNSKEFEDFSKHPKYSNEYGKFKIDSKEDEDFTVDYDEYAELSTCFGGAYDSGVFYLPQPNTHGLVSTIFSPSQGYQRYVWLGALITTSPSVNNVLKPTEITEFVDQINIPRDDDHGFNGNNDETTGVNGEYDNEYYNSEQENGFNNKTSNMKNEANQNHAIIFKQKETYWSKDSNKVAQGTIENETETKETIDWKKAKTFNFGVLDKDKIVINHQIYDEKGNRTGYGNFTISNDQGIIAEFSKLDNEGKKITSKIVADSEGNASISSNYKEEINNEFTANQKGITISHFNKKTNINGNITIEKSELNNNTAMTLSLGKNSSVQTIRLKSGENNGIDIEAAGDISLSPGSNGNIYLGGGTGTNYLLSYPSNLVASNIETASIVPVKNIRV